MRRKPLTFVKMSVLRSFRKLVTRAVSPKRVHMQLKVKNGL